MIQKIKDWLTGKIRYGAVRSSQWNEVRNAWVKEHPNCAVCGKDKDCEVHHCQPFHLKPELELDTNNFITLCRDHHFLFGHLLNWSAYNEDVKDDAKKMKAKITSRNEDKENWFIKLLNKII